MNWRSPRRVVGIRVLCVTDDPIAEDANPAFRDGKRNNGGSGSTSKPFAVGYVGGIASASGRRLLEMRLTIA